MGTLLTQADAAISPITTSAVKATWWPRTISNGRPLVC